MKVQVGQRWRWRTPVGKSEVIFEIQAIVGLRAECRYVQIIKKGYLQDIIGNVDNIMISFIENGTEYVYLEGQDKPT